MKWDIQLKYMALSLAYRELNLSRESCPASVAVQCPVVLIVPTAQIPVEVGSSDIDHSWLRREESVGI